MFHPPKVSEKKHNAPQPSKKGPNEQPRILPERYDIVDCQYWYKVNISIPEDLSDMTSNASVSDTLDPEIIKVWKVTPLPSPAPRFSLMELVIIFIINGKEIDERSGEMDPNEDYEHFDIQLTNLVFVTDSGARGARPEYFNLD